MTLEILTFEEYQRKQANGLQNPPPDVETTKEHREQDDVVCRGGWFIIPKTKLSCLEHVEKPVRLQDPPLLGVKMFLADEIHLVNMIYGVNGRTCSEYAQDIQNAASKRGIRCGYVAISFDGVEVGHAIVAFETDFGLKFFEPQSADEEQVIVGRRYTARLSGYVNERIITRVEIHWNDGTNKIME